MTRRIVTAIACLALAMFFAGCPTEVENDSGGLTITGLQESVSVYVFTVGTDLSTFGVVQNAVASRGNMVGRSVDRRGNTFLLSGLDAAVACGYACACACAATLGGGVCGISDSRLE